MHVAVVGSGMAGLAVARMLHDAGHQVTVFESSSKRGMDCHSLEFDGGLIDTPLRVMNSRLWKHTLGLASSLGIDMFPVRNYMSCTWLDDTHRPVETWLTSTRVKGLSLPIINHMGAIRKHGWSLVTGLFQLMRAVRQFLDDPKNDCSLGEFVSRYRINPLLWNGIVVPVLYTICTCSATTLRAWPARPLLAFIEQLTRGEPLLRMKGGTPALVDALIRGIPIQSGKAVTHLAMRGEKVAVATDGGSHLFDCAVVATPTNRLRDFVRDQSLVSDVELLEKFRFETGELVVHTDSSVMPRDSRQWLPLSYMMSRDFEHHQFSVWINAVEPTLHGKRPVFQTWRPLSPIDPNSVIASASLTRAVVDGHTAKLHRALQERHQHPGRRVFFCGSWSCDGLPILESAVTSAMGVAERLGATLKFKDLAPRVEISREIGY